MTPKQTALAAQLCKALSKIGEVRRRLTDKPSKYHHGVQLELSASEMIDDEGQGSSAFFYLPHQTGREVLDLTEGIIRKNLADLGVSLPKRRKARV